MAPQSITSQQLVAAGFTRMPDVWLYCPRQRRHDYFQRWYHPDWNTSFIPGYSISDPQCVSEDELLLLFSAEKERAEIMQAQK